MGFRRHGFRNQGLAGPGWSVQQHSPRGVYAQLPEQDRVLQWEFYHLTNFLNLWVDTADVLVADDLFLFILLLIDWFLLDYNLSVREDLDDSLRIGRNDGEGQSFGEQRHTGDEDTVACYNRALVEAASREAFDTRAEADLLLLCHHRAKHEALAGLGLDLGDADSVA